MIVCIHNFCILKYQKLPGSGDELGTTGVTVTGGASIKRVTQLDN